MHVCELGATLVLASRLTALHTLSGSASSIDASPTRGGAPDPAPHCPAPRRVGRTRAACKAVKAAKRPRP